MSKVVSPDELERQLREMNEALLISSVRQHELADLAQKSEAELRETNAKLRSHTDELTRFTHVAIGRESRVIELKTEVNELRRQRGEGAKYRVNFETDIAPSPVARSTMPSHAGIAPLESILCTEELQQRPSRLPDYATENRVLAALVQALADSPHAILQTLVDAILATFQVGSAGISLLTKDGKSFYWPAIAGEWKRHIGGGTPRDFGPCGDVLDRNAALLFKHVERRYDYFLPVRC